MKSIFPMPSAGWKGANAAIHGTDLLFDKIAAVDQINRLAACAIDDDQMRPQIEHISKPGTLAGFNTPVGMTDEIAFSVLADIVDLGAGNAFVATGREVHQSRIALPCITRHVLRFAVGTPSACPLRQE